MLPKVSFTDNDKKENGSKMLSRFGVMTRFSYPLLHGRDPVEQHNTFNRNRAKNDPTRIDPEKIKREEEHLNNILRDNSIRSNVDIDGYVRRMH